VQTWKVGLSWHVNEDLRLRGTTSIDIRAPTLNDLFAPIASSSIGYFDLLTNFAGTGTQQVTQGNPGLVPEVARTYTGGIVLTPRFIPGLTASVDFYSVHLKNAIGQISGVNTQIQALCNNSGGASPYCALYQRPIPFGQPGYDSSANYPTAVFTRNLNAAFQTTEGVDYEVNYGFNLADIDPSLPGQVNFRSMLNVAPVNNSMQFPGASVTRAIIPRGRFSLFADYTLGNWNVNTQLQWFSGFDKNGILPGQPAPPQIFAKPRVSSFTTVDINVSKHVRAQSGAEMELYFSVQNIGNQTPPIITGSSGNPGAGIPTPQGEDVMGRYFTIGVRGSF
jgi:outer membrane receptor protein involved in Fe transport